MELQEEGFRFHPTDSELLKFLLRFISKQPLCDDGFIKELDIYKQQPWLTYALGYHCGGDDDGDTSIFRYFITPRHKKKKENDRFRRGVGVGDQNLGTWKQLDKGKQVTSNSLIIGLKRSLTYGANKKNSSSPPNDHGKWLMKEYELSESILKRFTNSDLRDYVICAIKSNPNKNAIPTPINMVEPTAQFQEENCVFGFENNVPMLPQYQPSHEGCTFSVNEDPVADWQYQPLHEGCTGVNEDPICTFGVNEDPPLHEGSIFGVNAIPTPNNMVEPTAQFQVESGVLGFENNVLVLPQYGPSGCTFAVNEDPMADWQYQSLDEGCIFGVNEDPITDESCAFGVNGDPIADWQVRANELYTDFAGLIY